MVFPLTWSRFSSIWPTAFIFLFIFAFGLWSNPSLNPTYLPDSPSYIELARNFSSPVARDRPPGYSILIRLAMLLSPGGWPSLMVLLQIALLAFLAAMVQRACVSLLHLHTLSALAIALVVGSEPSLVANTGLIMADFPLGVCLLGVVLLVLRAFTRTEGADSPAGRRDTILAGLLSGFAALVKPQWLPGIALLVAGVVFMNVRSWRKHVRLLSILVAVHCVICGVWQLVLWIDFGQSQYSRLGSATLDMIALRNGDAKYAEGTRLYRYLSDAGLLQRSLALRWDAVEEFGAVKELIPMEVRCQDPAFYRKAFAVHGLAIAAKQIARWPSFFLHRPLGPSAEAFPGMPKFIRYLYLGAYNWLWRPFLLVLLLFALLWRSRDTALRQYVILSSAVVAGMSFSLVVLSYSEMQMVRLRICLVPVVLTLACAPVIAFAESLWSRVRRAGVEEAPSTATLTP
jgi:hypothetical protein